MSALRDSLLGKEKGVVDQAAEYCPSLSYKARLYGFGIFFALAFLFGVLGSVMFFVKIEVFAVLYSVSNLFGIASTMFLVGPLAQLRKMFKPIRLWAAILFLLMIAMTLFAALYLRNGGLVICFAVMQYCALFWYTLSYIPGARACCLACCKKTTGLDSISQ